MKFAQFQSTYKAAPIDTYERTGTELEAKYYKNREASSLLRQAMANTKVEDRNLGILAKATTDVEDQLNSVGDDWHRASNVLYNAKDRLVNDKALNASMEDYAKSQAEKQAQQKRLEEGKIGQEALSAFYTYEKLYNNKAIEVDENGQVINRWVAPTAPDKPDIDKKSMELVDMLLKNPDSVDSGLRSILDKNGMSSGYLERLRTEGVTDDKLFSTVKGWLANSDDVKDYYNYINRADLLSKTTMFDENKDVIRGSILPTMISEYRNMGWNVDEKGNLLDNYQHYINDRGEFDIVKDKDGKSVELPNAPKSIYDSPELKYLVNEQKMTVEDALQNSYLAHKLDSQLNSIADGYRKFAFNKTSVIDTIQDQEHWLQRKMQIEKQAANEIAYSTIDKKPMFTKNYSIRDAEVTYKQLQTAFDAVKDRPGTPEYEQARTALYEQTKNITTLSNAFAKSPEGKAIMKSQWQKSIASLPYNEQLDLTNKYYKAYTAYLTGNGTLPDELETKLNKPLPETKYAGGAYPFTYSPTTKPLEFSKVEFQKAIDKKLKTGIAIENNYRIFKDRDNNISKFHAQEGEYIKEHGNAYVLPQNTDKMGQPIKFQDYIDDTFDKKGYNPSWFDMEFFPSENTSTGYGEGVIKFIPNKNFPNDKTVPDFNPIVVRPDASISKEVLYDRARFVMDNSTDQEATKWAAEGMAMTMYGDTFAPLLNSLAGSVKLGGDRDVQNDRTIGNVQFGNKTFTMILKPVSTKNGLDNQLFFDQLSLIANDSTYPADKPVASGASIPEMISSLYIQNMKALTSK